MLTDLIQGLSWFAIALSPGCYTLQGSTDLKTVQGPQIQESIEGFMPPSQVQFGQGAFRGEEIYVSSNVGLFHFSKDTLTSLTFAEKSDRNVTGPWLASSGKLWIGVLADSTFRFLDSENQAKKIALPKASFTRGDFQEGFSFAVSGGKTFLVGGGRVWILEEETNAWKETSRPSDKERVAFVTRVAEKQAMVMRRVKLAPSTESQTFDSDQVFFFDQTWKELPNKAVIQFQNPPTTNTRPLFFEEVVTNGAEAFGRDHRGALFRIRSNGVFNQDSPGLCDAVTITSEGKLLAWIRDSGVWTLENDWKQLMPAPFHEKVGQQIVYLAEKNGRILLSVGRFPILDPETLQRSNRGRNGLWLGSNGSWQELFLDGKWGEGVLTK